MKAVVRTARLHGARCDLRSGGANCGARRCTARFQSGDAREIDWLVAV